MLLCFVDNAYFLKDRTNLRVLLLVLFYLLYHLSLIEIISIILVRCLLLSKSKILVENF